MKNKQTFNFVVGCNGSGKSSLAKFFARQLGASFFDIDTVSNTFTDFMLSNFSPERNPYSRESKFYLRKIRDLEYKALMDVAVENFNLGHSVFVSATFSQELYNKNWLSNFKRFYNLPNNTIFNVIFVTAPTDVIQHRIFTRNAHRDAFKIKNWQKFANDILPPPKSVWKLKSKNYFIIDTSIKDLDLYPYLKFFR